MAKRTNAELEMLLAERERELEKLKKRVVEVAYEAAEEQGWCNSGVRQALTRIGVDLPASEFDVVVTLRQSFRVDFSDFEDDSPIRTEEEVMDYVRDKLDGFHAMDVSVNAFDGSDWSDMETDLVQVNSVTAVDDS